MSAATEDKVESFGKLLQKKFETGRIDMIGAAKHLDKELEVLHRSVRVISSGSMGIEADQKHGPQVLEELEVMRGNIEGEAERNRGRSN